MHWIEKLEEYFEHIAPELQSEVRVFLDEYHEEKEKEKYFHTIKKTLNSQSKKDLEALKYLALSDHNIHFFLKKVSFLKNLKILEINAPVENLDFLDFLPKLRILKLANTKIKNIENKFSQLSKLIVLELSESQEPLDLSDELSNISNLLICQLTNYNEEFPILHSFPSNLAKAIYLSFPCQKIQVIPNLNQLSQLVHLNLYSNQIKKIPSSIGELKNLRSLSFAYNKINAFPNEVFLLSNLEELHFSGNPYEESPNVKMLEDTIYKVGANDDLGYLSLIKTLNNAISKTNNYNYVTLKIPKSLQTPMLQYIEFFRDYVVATKGKEIIFEVKREAEGLVLITNGNSNVTLPQLGSYFEEYVALTQQQSEDWVFNFEGPTSALQADILRLKMENEIGRLKNAFQIAKLESQHLSNQLSDKNAENQFLKNLSQSLSHKIDLLLVGKTAESLNVDQLLLDIQNQAVKMLERKHSHRLENLHNDVLTDFLRQKGYQVTDQTRSGRSKLSVGEIDIMIRKKDGTPFSIIEAFRLKSCGKDNKIVAEHLDKLLHDYDTAGHERNFVVIYAEAKRFEYLWKNYKNYINELNGKPAFRAEYPLIKFEEKIEISDKSSIKIGLATHRREGSNVEIYHIFINMFV